MGAYAGAAVSSLALVRANAAFRRLLLARAVSLVGDGVTVVALVLEVAQRDGSGGAVGALLLASSVPRFFGPLAGALADRFDQRRVMVACDLGQALAVGFLTLTLPPLPVLVALVAVASTLATAFGTAGRGALPALVAPGGLPAANAWLATARNLEVAVGPVLAGALVAGVGTRGALAVDAATFVASAVLLAGLAPLPPERAPGDDRRFLSAVAEGLGYAARHRLVRAVAVASFCGVVFGALDNLALPFLARRDLGAGPFGFGVVAAGWGAGMVLASVALLRLRSGLDPVVAFLAGWLLTGLGVLATGVAPSLAPAVAFQVVGGVGNGVGNVAEDTLLQRAVPRGLLGRAGGALTAAGFAGSAVAYAAGGALLDATSPRAVFVVSGVGVLVVTAAVAVPLRRAAGLAAAGDGRAHR